MGLLSRLRMLFKSKASAALDRAEDPRELVEYAYSQQQELLRKTKQGLIEVTTSKVRLEQQAGKLRAQVPRVEQQASRALQMGREDLARIALQRKQTVLAELDQLELQAAEIGEDERRLAHTEQELAARVEQFRVRRDSISARYSAAQAQVRVGEALSGVSGEFADLGMAMGRAMEKTERMQARVSRDRRSVRGRGTGTARARLLRPGRARARQGDGRPGGRGRAGGPEGHAGPRQEAPGSGRRLRGRRDETYRRRRVMERESLRYLMEVYHALSQL